MIQERIDRKKLTKDLVEKWDLFTSGKFKLKQDIYDTKLGKAGSPKKDFFAWKEEVQSEEDSDIIVVKKYSEEDETLPIAERIKLLSPSSPPGSPPLLPLSSPPPLKDH